MIYRNFLRCLLLVLCISATYRVSADTGLPELVRRVKPSVVAIATFDEKGQPLVTGSGFFIRPGQVVTNLHVIRGAYRAEIRTLDAKGRVFPVAGVLGFDAEG